jgi:heme exporter protein B
MQYFFRTSLAIFRKDWRSEIRTRYAMSSLLMFVVGTIAIIVFSVGGEDAPQEVWAGMLWVVIFFSSMSGLSRTFVSEEERGTALTLQLLSEPSAVLGGKLLFNIALVFILNFLAVLLYSLFIPEFVVRTASTFWITIVLGSLGLACTATIMAAIIAKAHTKGTLYPVLSLPVLLPLLLAVIKTTMNAAEGLPVEEAYDEFQFLIAYIVVVIAVSNMLFDYIWKD